MIRDLVKELRIFERNKVPLEIKVFSIATYIQASSIRRTAKPFQRFIQFLTQLSGSG